MRPDVFPQTCKPLRFLYFKESAFRKNRRRRFGKVFKKNFHAEVTVGKCYQKQRKPVYFGMVHPKLLTATGHGKNTLAVPGSVHRRCF